MTSTTAPATPHDCALSIAIDARGDVNIHHHCAPPPPGPAPGGESGGCPPLADGNTCLPPLAGRKHKQSSAQKLEQRQSRNRAPSVLAASTMHLVRRFLAGRTPGNQIEQRAFARLAAMPAAQRGTLACAVDRLATLPAAQREALFDPTLPLDDAQPLATDALAAAFGREIAQRASLAAHGELTQTPERPGRIRVFEPSPEEFFSQVRICSINALRTDDYIPRMPAAAYGPGEIAQDCTTTSVNGQPQVVCQVRTTNCVGGQVDSVCLRVPLIAAGDAVMLSGVNYFSTEAKVQLTAREIGSVHLFDAYVLGDLDTPVTEPGEGGQTRLVNDCRVHDHLSFVLPADLPTGLYDMQVVVPNITGIAAFGERILSNSEVIEVVPPPSARFQISLETLVCRKETPPAWAGSDEVGLRLIAMPLLADLSLGSPQVSSRRFGDVDSGDSRNLGQLLFDQHQPIVAVALSVIGYEVDGESAYANQVTKWTDAFIDLVKDQIEFIKDALDKAGIKPGDLTKLGAVGFVVLGVAIAVLLAIDLVIALWAPADPIIEDTTGYTLLDLAERTGAAHPMPPPSSFRTEGYDIDVKVKPLDKLPHQYREMREYESDREESRYEITYRFNRVA